MLDLLKKICLAFAFAFATTATSFAADLHAGGSPSDVASIKKAVAASVQYPVTDWFIAVKGNYAVAQFAMGPAAGGNYGLVKRGSVWHVTCKENSKGRIGSCDMPAGVYESLTAKANQLMAHQ